MRIGILYAMYIQCMFNGYSMYMQCISNVCSVYIQYNFKVTKYDLADARCTRCRSLPAVQPVQVYVGIYE